MGLDACVYCNCFESGRLKTQPKQEWAVSVEEDGAVEAGISDLEPLLVFDQWRLKQMCEHANGILLHHRLGNIALIGLLREQVFKSRASEFPIISGKVVYSGSHGGDRIEVAELPALRAEVERMARVHVENPRHEEFLRDFEGQMRELVETAIRVCKPIAF